MTTCLRACVILLVLGLLAPPGAFAAGTLRAVVDRDRIGEYETLTLRLIATQDGTGAEPDWSPLAAEFEILGHSQSSRTSIVNGVMSRTREWALELAPLRVGVIEIPALSVGALRSAPLTVEVVAEDTRPDAAASRVLFLEAAVDTAEPYVQQPILYAVRVIFREQPQRAVLSEPQIEGALVERFGEDRTFAEFIDGQRYTVIERRYLVTPQRSGELTLISPRLEALLPDRRPGARRDPLADFDEWLGGRLFQSFPDVPGMAPAAQRIVQRAEDVAVRARPRPAGAADPWFPARSVELTEEWIPAGEPPRVGEPLTRTLTLAARGATAAQIPTLTMPDLTGAQLYADRPQSETLVGTAEVAAVKHLAVAIVPTQPGPLRLPPVRVSWWDTETDQPREAAIPERILNVEPAVAGQPAPPAAVSADMVPERGDSGIATAAREGEPTGATGRADRTPVDDTAEPAASAALSPWVWFALLFAAGWLLTLGAWWRERRRAALRQAPGAPPAGAPVPSLHAARARLATACLASTPREAREAVLDWARARWPAQPPSGLVDLAQRLTHPEAAAVLGELDRALYAPPGTSWDGPAAWTRLESVLDRAPDPSTAETVEPLPPLYKG